MATNAEPDKIVEQLTGIEEKMTKTLEASELVRKTGEEIKELDAERERKYNELTAKVAEIEGNGGKVSKALSARLEDFERRYGRANGPDGTREPELTTQKAVGAIFEDWAKDNSAFLSDARVPGNRVRKSNSIILDGVSFARQHQAIVLLRHNGITPTNENIQKALQLSDATRFAPVFRDSNVMPISRSRLVMRSMMQTRSTGNSNSFEYLLYHGAGENTPLACDSVTSTTTTATLTTTAAHSLRVGDWIKVAGAADAGYNGYFRVVTVPTATTCTYTIAAATPDTTTGTIVYTHLSRFGAAAGVAEAGAKPQAKVFPELKEGSCQVKAHYFKVTRQAMDDIQGISSDLNTWGVQGIAELEEDELLYGAGTSTALQGILGLTTIQTRTQDDASDKGRVSAYRKAMTDVELSGGMATGIVMHPIQYEGIELAFGLDDHFIYEAVDGRVWRIPTAVTKRIAPGTALVGDFSSAILYERQGTNISFADQNEDDFINNLLAVRFEERIGVAWQRPEMFVNLTITT